MLGPLINPKILIITFALQFQRVENEFTSLENLISQEREHIMNLVGRLAALKPDLIFVQKSVSHIAMQYLIEANIAVVQNVKFSLLESIAKCTKSDIIHSIEKLVLQPRLGTCKKFSYKTFLNSCIPGFRKTFIYLEECEERFGCSLVLRGGTLEELKIVKVILEITKEAVDLIVFFVYSLKLEKSFFRDESAALSIPAYGEEINLNYIKESIPKTDHARRALMLFEHTILSGSPGVRFDPPYLLLKMQSQLNSHTLPVPTILIVTESNVPTINPSEELIKSKINDSSEELFDLVGNATDSSAEKNTSSLIYNIENAESLSPFSQQSIGVLFSNLCSGSTVPCISPETHLIEFYRSSDLTLGQYIEDTCFGSTFACPLRSCEKLMLNHSRNYAHGQSKVNVKVSKHKCPLDGQENEILMWSICRICEFISPFLPMSEETWKYSFGKYLELTFHHKSPVLLCTQECPHDIHRYHSRYFGLKDISVSFEFDEIQLYEVFVPPMQRKPSSKIIEKIKLEDFEEMRAKMSMFYNSVINRITGFTYEILSVSKKQAASDYMLTLGNKATSEKKLMLQVLQQTYISSPQLDSISINLVYKQLLENVASWEFCFSEFVRIHLHSDSRDIRRATAAQFKRIFDRDTAPTFNEGKLSIGEAADADLPALSLVQLGTSPSKDPVLDVVNSDTTHDSTFRRKLSQTFSGLASQMPSISDSPTLLPTNTDNMDYIPNLDDISLLSRSQALEDEIRMSKSLRNVSIDVIGGRNTDNGTILSTDTDRGSIQSSSAYHTLPRREEFPDIEILDEDESGLSLNTFTGVAVENQAPLKFLDVQRPGERASILQTISALWNGNAANFLPLIYPSYTYF